jgi:hypothetical protein
MNGDKEKSDAGTPEDTKAIPEVTKAVELTDDALASVAGGSGDLNSLLTNVSKTKHEISKGIIQNIRG